MDERRVADYFVVAGLPGHNDDIIGENEVNDELEDWCQEGTHLKDIHMQPPITDLAVIFPALGEQCPEGYTLLEYTVSGIPADLNHGSLRTNECYLCYRRGRDKPPLVDIGVIYEGKERIMQDAQIVLETPKGHIANVNNSTSKIFVTYRRASQKMPCNSLVVTDICVILKNKGETPPHAFCVINKNLNKGMLGSDVFLCYKKSMNRANLISFKPAILYKYPTTDYNSFVFPNSVAMFCLPMGATIECWPKMACKPKSLFSTFVLTVSDAAQKIYGSAITFYEEFTLPPDALSCKGNLDMEDIEENTKNNADSIELTEEFHQSKAKMFRKYGILKKLNISQWAKLQFTDPSSQSLNISKSICILSHWPFFDTFEKFLVFLHSMVNGKPQNVSIEKYISYFLCDIPFPSPQRSRILVQLSSKDRLILTQPEDLVLPRSGASFRQLLINLGPDNCLLILLLILTEQKILVHSLRPDVLTSVSEAIAMILFPFKWQCPYIPLCPLGLAEVLHAPLPFLIGVDSRFFDLYDPPSDVNCVNLDTNNIAICDDKKYLNVKLLPKKAARQLRNCLEHLYSKLTSLGKIYSSQKDQEHGDFSVDKEFQQKQKEQALELEIQDAFLKFTATILKGYRSFLLPITKAPTVGSTDPTSLFNMQEFLRSRDKAHAKFYSMLVRTQMFIRFIEERSFVSDMDMAGLAFFDECTERVEEENVTLLELDESQHSERTVFIPPPDAGPNHGLFIYKTFKLNSELMRPEKNFNLRNPALNAFGIVPGSPMARRTKHEIKVAQKMARKQAAMPDRWARCLLGTCYSLWFLHLPAMLQASSQPAAILHQAYELLVRMQKLHLDPMEEVCYRAMMQLCGVYGQPVLAVKLLFHMKRSGVQPNALTYGFYNKAVLEATWPSDMTNSSQLMWNKLRNVIVGAALFKKAGRKGARRRHNSNADFLNTDGITEEMEHALSRSSLDSSHSQDTEAAHSDSTKGSSVPDLPGFGSYELKTKLLRQNSIVKDQALPNMVQSEKLNRSFSNPRIVRSTESPLKSPVRTPVTENDPLGALINDETPVVSPSEENDSNCSTSTLTVLNNTVEERPGGPLLFRSNNLPRSATFHQAVDESSTTVSGNLQRSETMPHSVAPPGEEREKERLEISSLWSQKDSVTSSLSSLGSSLKLSFGRYSASGLAFTKNKELISSNQLIESLSLSSYISPSGLTGKRSNEIILGGLNSLKSAATSVAKKFDEIKEAISATSTPVKLKERDQKLGCGISHESLDSCTDGSLQDRNEVSARLSGDGTLDVYLYELGECLYPKGSRDLEERAAIEFVLSSASRCHHCAAILYDEEIMAGWQPEDSNLNTVCQYCDKATVPLLTVTILDYRCKTNEKSSDPLMGALVELSDKPREQLEPITIPYLNPLVLRKELESVLSQEGDVCLTRHIFIEEHPIVYWNLIWYFERINLTSHLSDLWLHNDANKQLQSNSNCVSIRTMWDNERIHMGRLPMYLQWKLNTTEDRTLMQTIISYVRCNDLTEPIKKVALERSKNQSEEEAPFSIYRDILFLAFIAVGGGNIHQGVFDKQYASALERLTENEEHLLHKQDAPPSLMSLYCRHYFKQLIV
ncbi:PREDICTED: DENN domain-containing protein 4C isoform X1 [Polistes dominula]|uniref:DENN domain-containing protein 4C isoform X1 n=1 Tax=Polistes dominula TaxID=743375 RepID=A0ABM1I7Z3_POLDO|nr:PREDICTED: DENN domain-containing protein 4C isoform X1 [Polistes dominula]XP_015176330.1 PREDICTED: DENN domain-containing protein 4C isoform X1 [Polistes dominula]XP_015176338.1 PREDICTED: DENN domain-containing protein 4C isoform X1 [Polistes dominula]XP_015176348.1 PREDICTED: DENN domain-containing protein 4C isoform X1 [Polistes dominula]